MGLSVGHQSVTSVLVISRLIVLTPQLLVPEPLLPALVEGLGLVHAIPVAIATAVPVVTKVAILVSIVAKVATATAASLLELVVMSPGSTTMHAGSTSSAHVSPVHWATSAHGSPSGSHVTPHRSAPGGST